LLLQKVDCLEIKDHKDREELVEDIQAHMAEEYYDPETEIIAKGDSLSQILFLVQGTL
jgi:hypothetical protein